MGSFELLAAFTHAVPALVWAVVAQSSWAMVRLEQPQSRFFRLLPVVAVGVALTYTIFTLICLLPAEQREQRTLPVLVAYAVHDGVLFLMVGSARHLSCYFPTPEREPTALWLAVNYGSSVIMCLLGLAFVGLLPIPGVPAWFGAYPTVRIVYQLIMLGLVLVSLVPVIRPGGMSAGVSSWLGVRRADTFFLGAALISLCGWLVLATNWEQRRLWQPTYWGVGLDAIVGFGFAAPVASRFLGHVVRNVLVILGTGLAAGVLSFAAVPWVIAAVGEDYAPAINLTALVVIVVIFVPGQAALRRAIDASILKRSRQLRDQLHVFLQGLSAQLGVTECSRRALAELTRVMHLRGAALIVPEGEAIVHGSVDAAAKLAWTDVGKADIRRALLGNELRELPLEVCEVLTAADIVGVVPVASPRRHHGVLLLATGLLGATFTDEEKHALCAFADQLALVLDGAELVASAVAAQRSLAHAEKLAAIGELAARVAHEIRNPVTAARSLAQQLCRDPTSPLNAEHAALIVEEMERVERRIAALLQYARKDELRREPVDLCELAQGAGRAFATRFDDGHVAFSCGPADGTVVARVDREGIRQVLVNLIENALDALASQPERRLALEVTGANGTAEMRLTDNGPGVAPEALGRLFEPFFSLKPKGTGLGLAIAKRIVEAHGGELRVGAVESGGLQFVVLLPTGEW